MEQNTPIKPQYVTGDMFLNYTGVNLEEKLRNDDNISNKVDIFLFRVEKRLKSWIDKRTFRVVHWNALNSFQLEQFQFAILEQAQYIWKYGDISLDPGYDQERGIVASKAQLEDLAVCEPAINFLVEAGLFNLKIKNRKRWMNGDTFGIIGERAVRIVPGQGPCQPQPGPGVICGIGYTEK